MESQNITQQIFSNIITKNVSENYSIWLSAEAISSLLEDDVTLLLVDSITIMSRQIIQIYFINLQMQIQTGKQT